MNIDFIVFLKFINVNKLEYICLVSSLLRHSSLIYKIKNNFKSYNYTSQSTESNPLLLVKHKIENPISFSSLTFSGTKQRLNANLFKYGFYKIDLCNDDRSEIQIWSSNSDNSVQKNSNLKQMDWGNRVTSTWIFLNFGNSVPLKPIEPRFDGRESHPNANVARSDGVGGLTNNGSPPSIAFCTYWHGQNKPKSARSAYMLDQTCMQ